MMDEIYTKKIPLTIRIQDQEERRSSVQVSVLSANRSTGSFSEKEFIVRLTDETDPFFLFVLHLNDEEFKRVKSQQNLNVDFSGFPKMITHLFDRCLKEQHETPKYLLQLVCNSLSVLSTAHLNVIETNMFQDITYLSLQFLPATDADVKNYLAGCLKTLKDQHTALLLRHQTMESELTSQLRQTRETLSARMEELTDLKANFNAKVNEIANSHGHDMNQEKDKALQLQTSLQQRYEREKKDLEQAHVKLVKQLEARCQDLDAANKELTDFKYKAESNLRELRSKLNITDGETSRKRQDVQNLQTENLALQSECHEKEKLLGQLKTRVAVLEQETKDKDEILRKNTELLEIEQNIRRKAVDESEQSKQFYAKEKANRRKLSAEVQKGNEIIKKFQGENFELADKIRIRTQIALEQEKLLKGKQLELEKESQEKESLNRAVSQLEDDKKRLNESLKSTLKKLEDSQQVLQSNEQLISYLNKRLTETQMIQLPHSGFEPGSSFGPTSSTFYRPPNTLQKTFSGSTQSASYTLSPKANATTGNSNVQYQVSGLSGIPVPTTVGKSNSLGSSTALPEELRNARSLPPGVPSHPKPEDIFIDPKYLQHREGGQPRPTARTSSPPMLHYPSAEMSGVRPAKDFAQSSAQDSRNANRQNVAFRNGENPRFPPQPALASSYFPSKAS